MGIAVRSTSHVQHGASSQIGLWRMLTAARIEPVERRTRMVFSPFPHQAPWRSFCSSSSSGGDDDKPDEDVSNEVEDKEMEEDGKEEVEVDALDGVSEDGDALEGESAHDADAVDAPEGEAVPAVPGEKGSAFDHCFHRNPAAVQQPCA